MSALQKDSLAEIDEWIRQAHGSLARRELRKIAKIKIPREDLLKVASLARRAGLPFLAVKLLNPVVRGTRKNPPDASDEEKAAYAASLTRIGAPEEALTLLKSLDPQKSPAVFFFEALAHVAQWDYEAAIPCLLRYVKESSLDPYQRLVAKVNLADGFVFERKHEEAGRILEELRVETKEKGFSLLYGNSLELSAQNSIFRRKWSEAESFLKQAESSLKEAETIDEFFVRKWRAILRLFREGPAARALKSVEQVREEALKRGHWETIRDCDFFEAISTHDNKLLVHLYYGTRFESFRKNLFLDVKKQFEIPQAYLWNLGKKKRENEVLDLLNGTLQRRNASLNIGKLSHRLVIALASDFYRPHRIASLHFAIYPDDFFNPITSPLRVRQAIKRLREWIEENRVPLSIEEKSGLYTLASPTAISIKISQKEILGHRHPLLIQRLRGSWSKREFTALEAAKSLDMSYRSTMRVLAKAQEESVLTRLGSGPSSRYVFPK